MTLEAERAPGSATPAVAQAVPLANRTAAVARRRNTRAYLLAVLVVLLGGVVALFGGLGLSRHSQVLAVVRPVQAGSAIVQDDLAVANVTTDPRLSPIPAAEESQVIGMIAQVPLAPGGLLIRAELGTGTGFAAGEVLVALPLKPGQFPGRGLIPGQHVLVVATAGSAGAAAAGAAAAVEPPGTQPGGTQPGGTVTTAAPGSGAAAGGTQATIAEVGAADASSQVTVVDVRVAAAQGGVLADLASTGKLALILLPTGG